MTDEEYAVAINEFVKVRYEDSVKNVMMWWFETGLEAFSGRTPEQILEDGYGQDLLEYVEKYYV